MKKIILCLLIMSLCLSGCTSPLKRFKPTETPVSDLSGEALLFDGSEIYQRTLALIDAAHTSVYLEQTILDDPAVIDALIRQSVAGLEIRILLDQWQSANKATVEQLKNHDISVQYYPALKGQVDHINLLISDNKQALLYGQRLAPAGLGRMLAILLPEKSSWRCAGVFAKDWE
ncbi:MAG: hypothetical protein LBT32_03680 [Peptococcaceae bacterium]|jgi:phosphatidylserine/phosphatidylglycerophosphate/cardiolipin synthase-like enzyme|nr:hypothetical protein [Peptococcaceae bacterium]